MATGSNSTVGAIHESPVCTAAGPLKGRLVAEGYDDSVGRDDPARRIQVSFIARARMNGKRHPNPL